MSKKRIIVDYKTLPNHILDKLAQAYPDGLDSYTIKYTNSKGQRVSAVPMETEEAWYLVKLSVELRQLVYDLDPEDTELRNYEDDLSYDVNDDYDD